jgi:hypothetical protein
VSAPRFCAECGTALEAGARFCAVCGAGVEAPAVPSPPAAPRRARPAAPAPRPAPPRAAAPADGMAVAAFGAAVLWLFGVGTLAALVLGHRSRRRIARSGGTLGGSTWALAALAVAYATLTAAVITVAAMQLVD